MRIETSSTDELFDTHRLGHTCANLDGRLLFVWGGSDEIRSASQQSQRFSELENDSENRHIWILDTLTGYWRRRSCSGECPPFLSGSTSSLIGQRMFVFGGHSTSPDNWFNDLYCLDLDTFVWTDLGSRAQMDPIKPIKSNKSVSWTHEGKFYIFGGYGWSQVELVSSLQLLDRQQDFQLITDYKLPKFGWNNQLVEYDPRLRKWTWPSYSGKCPSARAAHSGALIGSKYYVFGGRDYRTRLNDLYTFCMKSHTWTQIAVVEDPNYRRLERPIRHLLEQPDDDDTNQTHDDREASGNNMDVELDEDDELDMGDDDEEEQNRYNASPSSSTAAQMAAESSKADKLDQPMEASYFDDDDDDDISDEVHPSQLPDRWSAVLDNMSEIDCDVFESHVGVEFIGNQAISSSTVDETAGHSDLHIDVNQSSPQADVARQLDSIEQSTNNQTAPLPTGRSFSSFTPINDDEILLFGGISPSEVVLADCWTFNIRTNQWKELDLNINHPRVWHTCSKTDKNEIIVIGGSNHKKFDTFCTDVLTLSLEPKTLKKMALDSVAKSIKMRDIHRIKSLPPTICKLIRLRKQARALTIRKFSRQTST